MFVSACWVRRDNRTCVPLEARAPLGAGYNLVGARVAGLEERIGARLVPVQVEALDLWLVQLDVKVRVQPGEHPAQGVLTDRWRPDLELCWRKVKEMRDGGYSQAETQDGPFCVNVTWLTVLLWLLDLDSLVVAVLVQHSEPVSQTTHHLLQVRLTAHWGAITLMINDDKVMLYCLPSPLWRREVRVSYSAAALQLQCCAKGHFSRAEGGFDTM